MHQGKVCYVACSNLSGWQLARYLSISDAQLHRRFVSVQPVYNALNRSAELEILPLCEDQGLGVIPYNPLAAGSSPENTVGEQNFRPVPVWRPVGTIGTAIWKIRCSMLWTILSARQPR